MDRRAFLASTIPMGAALVSGCVKSPRSCTDEAGWPPDIEVGSLALPPGGFGGFEIRTSGITSFQFDSRLYPCGVSDAPVKFVEVETAPPPDVQADSCPPIWVWENCTAVTVDVPVDVAPDAEPGQYEYGFQIAEDIGERNAHTYEYAIEVTA